MADPDVPPPLDLLLARRDWVRRFARVLARDDWAADDLSQDAWVAAVERTPAHAEAPAGWFRRVMTRRAMDAARAARRRAAHEQAAPRRGPAADVADVVAAAEMHRRVVEAVVALEEPYRATILLRFFEDLPPREVAARMDVPVETVRSRVRRAVAQLRLRLDEGQGGRRAAWLAPLLAAGGEQTRPAPGIRGGVAMRWIVLVGVAAGAAAVVGLVTLAPPNDGDRAPEAAVAGDEDEAQDDGGTAAPRTERPRGTDGRVAAPGESSGASDSAAAPAVPGPVPPLRDFDVVVTDGGGAPVSGVRVRLDPAEMDEEPEGVTGADGRARIRVAGPVRSVTVEERGADGRAWRPRISPVETTPAADGAAAVVDPGVWIRGEVVLEDGRPYAWAEVVAIDAGRRIARTNGDANGAFALAVPPLVTCDVVVTGWSAERFPEKDRNGPSGRVRVGVGRWGPFDAESPQVAAPAEGLRLVARVVVETATLRVHVVDEEGRPVAGVPLLDDCFERAWAETRPEPSVTDAEGRCEIAEVPRRRASVLVSTRDPDRRPWEESGLAAPARPLSVRPGVDEVRLVFPRGVRVRGRVEVPATLVRRKPGPTDRVSVGVAEGTQQVASATARADDTFEFLAPLPEEAPRSVSAWLVDAAGITWRAQAPLRPDSREDLVLRLEAEPRPMPPTAVRFPPAPVAPK